LFKGPEKLLMSMGFFKKLGFSHKGLKSLPFPRGDLETPGKVLGLNRLFKVSI